MPVPKFYGKTGLQVIKLQSYLEMLPDVFQYVCTALGPMGVKRAEFKYVQCGMKLL